MKTLKPLNQDDYKMKIIEDLGTSQKPKGRFAICECTKCKDHFKVRMQSVAAKKQTTCYSCTLNEKQTCEHPLYKIWHAIKRKCYDSKRKDYKYYGAKGVTMYEQWVNKPQDFIDWCLANGWNKSLVIDKDVKCRELGISPAVYAPNTISFITTQQNAEEANGKPVIQLSLDDKYITEYASTAKAALALGKDYSLRSSINKCARGKQHTAFGFKWKYKVI